MNTKLYKLKYDKQRGEYVAVSEVALSQGKSASGSGIWPSMSEISEMWGEPFTCRLRPMTGAVLRALASFFGRASLISLTGVGAGVGINAAIAADLPTGGQIVAGQGAIQNTNSTTLTVNQDSQKLITNWQSFNVGAGHTVIFNQPSSSSVALNRVLGNTRSDIAGTIQANGQVYLLNPNGILFSKTSQVNVGSLVAGTQQIGNSDFLSGNLRFSNGGVAGAQVVNEGTLTVAAGGHVVLMGQTVINEGKITANKGQVVLSAGETISLSETLGGDASGQISVKVDEASLTALVENKGLIVTNGGQVFLTAHGRELLTQTVVNNSGIIRATSLDEQNGEIVLDGGASGAVLNSGTLDVSGLEAGQTGGTVKMAGQYVGVLNNEEGSADNSKIDARGDAGGGTVLIGGDYQGKDSSEYNGSEFTKATTVLVDANAVIDASAVNTGKGGKVVLWSEDYTNFSGNILARGGQRGAGGVDGTSGDDGGLIETSSKNNLQVTGQADARAYGSAKAGEWLLDPTNVTISTAVDAGGTATTTSGNASWGFGTNATATISNATINNALNNGTNVTISTSSNGTGTGNIDVNASINKTEGGSASLTLNANGSINVNNASIKSTVGLLNITLNAATGAVNLNIATLQTNSGNLSVTGNQASTFQNSAISVGGGQGRITLNSSSGAALTLSGSNDFGKTTQTGSSNSLQVNATGSGGAQGVVVASGASINNQGTVTIEGNSGSGIGVQLQGANTLNVLSGSSTIKGSTSTGSAGVEVNVTSSSFLSGSCQTLSVQGIGGTGIGINLSAGNLNTVGTVGLVGSGTTAGLNLSSTTLFTQVTNQAMNLSLTGSSSTAGNAVVGLNASIASNLAGSSFSLTTNGSSNNITLTSINVSNLSLATDSGDITVNGILNSSVESSFNASGNVVATNAGNTLNRLKVLNANNINIAVADTSVLNLSTINVTKNITINASNGFALTGNLTSAGGSGNSVNLTTTAGGISISNAVLNTNGAGLNIAATGLSSFANASIAVGAGIGVITLNNSATSQTLGLGQTVRLCASASGSLTLKVNNTNTSAGDGTQLAEAATLNLNGNVTLNSSSTAGYGFVITGIGAGIVASNGSAVVQGNSFSSDNTKAGVRLVNLTTPGTNLSSSNGTLSLIGTSNSSATGLLVTAGTHTFSGNVTLNGSNTGNGIALAIGASSGEQVNLTPSGSTKLSLIGNATTANQSLLSSGCTTIAESVSNFTGGDLSISIKGTQDTGLSNIIANNVIVNASNGNLTLSGANINVSSLNVSTAKSLTLNSTVNSNNGNITLAANGASTLNAVTLNVGTGTALINVTTENASVAGLTINNGLTVNASGVGSATFNLNARGGTANVAHALNINGGRLNNSGNVTVNATSDGTASAILIGDGTQINVNSGITQLNGTINSSTSTLANNVIKVNGAFTVNASGGALNLSGVGDRTSSGIAFANAPVNLSGNVSFTGNNSANGSGIVLGGANNVFNGNGTGNQWEVKFNGSTVNGSAIANSASSTLNLSGVNVTINQNSNVSSNFSAAGIAAGNLSFTSTNGGIAVTNGTVSVSGRTNLSAGGNGDITFNNTGNMLTGQIVIAEGGKVNILNTLDTNLGVISATNNISFLSDKNITLNGNVSSTSGNITLGAGNGVSVAQEQNILNGNLIQGDVKKGSMADGGISVAIDKKVTFYSGNADSTNLIALVSGASSSNITKKYGTTVGNGNGNSKVNLFYRVLPVINLSGGSFTLNYSASDYTPENLNNGNASYIGGVHATGMIDGDSQSSVLAPVQFAKDGASQSTVRNAGTYVLAVNAMSLSSDGAALGYASLANGSRTNGQLVVNKANVTFTLAQGQSKVYDGNTTVGNFTQLANNVTVSRAGTNGFLGDDKYSGSSNTFNGSFFYTDKNVKGSGNSTIALNNVSISDGNSGQNYQINYVNNTASSITPSAIIVSAANVRKTYDGTTTASTTATLIDGNLYDEMSGGTFAFVDNANVSGSARNAGSNKTVSVSNVTISDGNSGANYNITYQNNTTSIIEKRQITVIANGSLTKTYDGTVNITANAALANVSGNTMGQNDTLNSATFAFADRNVSGGPKLVQGSGANITTTLNSPDPVANYDIVYQANQGTITAATISIAPNSYSRDYDGSTVINNPSLGVIGINGTTLFSPVGYTPDTFNIDNAKYKYTNKNVGTSNKTVSVSNVSINDGNNGANYNIVYADNTNSTITPYAIVLGPAAVNKVYDGTTSVSNGAAVSLGALLIANETVTSGVYRFTDKNAGGNKTVNLSNVTIKDANGTGEDVTPNYNISYRSNNASSIARANLTVAVSNITKTYNGTTIGTGSISPTNGTVLYGSGATADTILHSTISFNTKNAGQANYTVVLSNLVVGDGTESGRNNYNISSEINTGSTIVPVSIQIAPHNISKTYDGGVAIGDAINPSVAATNGTVLYSGDNFVYSNATTYSFIGSGARNAGTNKTVSVTNVSINDGNNGGNYILSYVNATNAIIQKKNVTVTVANVTKVYDKTTAVPSAIVQTVAGSSLATGGENDSFTGAGTFSYTSAQAGSNRTVTVANVAIADGNGGQNYNITYSDNINSTITPAPVSVNNIVIADKVYDGTTVASLTSNVSNATLTGIFSGDDVRAAFSGAGSGASFATANAGANIAVTINGLSLNGSSASNYVLASGNVSSLRANITQRPVTFSVVNATKVYDGTTDLNSPLTLTNGSFVNITGGVVDTWAGGSYAFDNKNAGNRIASNSAQISINGAINNGTGNYQVSYLSVNGTISKSSIYVSSGNISKTYDGTTTINRSAYTLAPVALGVGDSIDSTGYVLSFADKNAGSGKVVKLSNVTILGSDGTNSSSNYDINISDNNTSTILQANIKLAANSATKVYDGTVNASASSSGANFSQVGFITEGQVYAGDNITSAALAFQDKNAGSNKTVNLVGVVISDGTAAGRDNYQITTVPNVTGSISPLNLTVGLTNITKTYDGTTNATVNTSASAGQLLLNSALGRGAFALGKDDKISSGNFTFNNKNVGQGSTVTINTLNIADGNMGGNYNLICLTNTNSAIVKANVLLTVANISKVYDGTTDVLTGRTLILSNQSTNSLGLGDSVSGGTFAFTDKNARTSATKTVVVANANIADSNNVSMLDNYNISYVNNTTSQISQRPITISANPVNKIYDGSTAASGQLIVVDGAIQTGDRLYAGNLSFADRHVGVDKVVRIVNGNTSIIGDGVNNSNYVVTRVATTGNITPAHLSLSATNVVKTYDGTTVGHGNVTILGGDLTGFAPGDSYTGANYAYDNVDAGVNKKVTLSGLTVQGTDGKDNTSDYRFSYVPSMTGIINKALLNVSGFSVLPKAFDGTNIANVNVSAAKLSGYIVPGDDPKVEQINATYQNGFAGQNKLVTLNYAVLQGKGSRNYQVVFPQTPFYSDITGGILDIGSVATPSYLAGNTLVGATRFLPPSDRVGVLNSFVKFRQGLLMPAGLTFYQEPSFRTAAPRAQKARSVPTLVASADESVNLPNLQALSTKGQKVEPAGGKAVSVKRGKADR